MTKQAALTVTRALVEAVADERVELSAGEQRFLLPSVLLPDGISAGHWIELRIHALAPPRDDPERP